jgi:CRP/FNR family transcriptional regulator, cyclic AMP receptor protein
VQTIDQLIAQAEIFEGLEPAQLELLAACAVNAHIAAGAMVLRLGEAADHFYLIRRGTVSLEVPAPAGGALRIETLEAGDAVGWSWLFAPYRWQLDARAIEACDLVSFDGACLRGKCEADHELGYELMRRFAAQLIERLQATRLQLLDVYGRAASPA